MTTTIVATELMAKIEIGISRDQGNAYRKYLGELVPNLDDAFRVSEFKFRPHMGASLQGNKCARAIWYSFRWAVVPNFPARVLRLFNRGHMEEARFIAALRCADVTVWQYDANGKQYGMKDAYGHYGGSGDGIAYNVPQLPAGAYAVAEFKTHSSKSFASLVKDGVKISKWEHYVQMQQYMYKFNYPYAVYGAVNKDNDDLHFELVALDRELAERVIDRASKIIWMDKAPAQIGSPPSPGNFGCKFCDYKAVCHTGMPMAKNCRTCTYSEPAQEGDPVWGPADGAVWLCRMHNVRLGRAAQEAGCKDYQQMKA